MKTSFLVLFSILGAMILGTGLSNAIDFTIIRDAGDSSTNLMVIEKYDGTDMFWVDRDGYAYVNGTKMRINSITCAGGEGFTAFSNITGLFTCTNLGGAGSDTHTNVGTGEASIALEGTGSSHQFKTLEFDGSFTVTNYTNRVLVNFTGGGSSVTSDNVGGGNAAILIEQTGGNVDAKRLKAGSGIALSNFTNYVMINSSMPTHDYFIDKDGSDYIAYDQHDGDIVSTNTDFNTVITAAINDGCGSGKTKLLLAPDDFTLETSFSTTCDDIHIEGWGMNQTRILAGTGIGNNVPVIVLGKNDGADNTFYNVYCTGGSNGQPCTSGNVTIQFDTNGDENNFKKGDRVTMISDKDWYLFGAEKYFQGEIHTVRSVSDAANTITIHDGLFRTFGEADNPRISRHDEEDTIFNPVIRDLSIFDGRSGVTGNDIGNLWIYGAENGLVENVWSEESHGNALSCIGCTNTVINNFYAIRPDSAGNGLAFRGGNNNFVDNLTCRDIHHCLDGHAIVGASKIMYYGASKLVTATNIHSVESDTGHIVPHPPNWGWTLNNIVATNTNVTGQAADCIGVRGNYTTVSNVLCVNTLDDMLFTDEDGGEGLTASNFRGVNVGSAIVIGGNATNVQVSNVKATVTEHCIHTDGADANEPTINSGDNSTFSNITCHGDGVGADAGYLGESNRHVTIDGFWFDNFAIGVRDADDETPGRGGHLQLLNGKMTNIANCMDVTDLTPTRVRNVDFQDCTDEADLMFYGEPRKWIRAVDFTAHEDYLGSTLDNEDTAEHSIAGMRLDDGQQWIIGSHFGGSNIFTDEIIARIHWTFESGSGDVEFGFACNSWQDNEWHDTYTMDFNDNVTDTRSGVKHQITDFVAIDCEGNPDNNDFYEIYIVRNALPFNTADTMTGDVFLLAVELYY